MSVNPIKPDYKSENEQLKIQIEQLNYLFEKIKTSKNGTKFALIFPNRNITFEIKVSESDDILLNDTFNYIGIDEELDYTEVKND